MTFPRSKTGQSNISTIVKRFFLLAKADTNFLRSNTNEYGIDTSELDKFKETMINAIRKRKEEWKTGINNPYFDKARTNAIEAIEQELQNRNLKAKDLGEYSNYKEQINNLDRQWKVYNLRDKIVIYIRSIGNKGKYPEKKEEISEKKDGVLTPEKKNFPTESVKKFIPPKKVNSGNECDDLDRESLIKKIRELEEEIRELKQEKEDIPEFNEYFNKKQNDLQENKQKLEKLVNSDAKPKPENLNNFLTVLIAGGGFLLVMVLIATSIIKKRKIR